MEGEADFKASAGDVRDGANVRAAEASCGRTVKKLRFQAPSCEVAEQLQLLAREGNG